MNDVWQFVIYDAFGKLVAEYGGNPQQDEGGIKYYLQDWQGSVRAGVNAGGFVKSRTDHQAFGEDIASGVGLRTTAQGFGAPQANRQGYGLTEKDSTGLNHTWFRKNENRAGRWTSPDPYNGSASVGNPQSWNRYSYVESQPTNFVDPSGLLTMHCELRFVVPVTCSLGEGGECGFDWARAGYVYVCTFENSRVGTRDPRSVNPGSGGGFNQLGRDRPYPTGSDADRKYEKCMKERVRKDYERWKGTIIDLVGKVVIKGAFTAVIGLLSGALGGALTRSAYVALITGGIGVLTTAAVSGLIDNVFDIKKAGDDFVKDVEDSHDKCSLDAYGELKPFPGVSRFRSW
ncbi:MAG: hypothetical protein IPN69_25115 [Acidobacteria bacterium]|nr:hypothetical protein [Acidobacteriota bacterium]